jgi:hypothetical protein
MPSFDCDQVLFGGIFALGAGNETCVSEQSGRACLTYGTLDTVVGPMAKQHACFQRCGVPRYPESWARDHYGNYSVHSCHPLDP